MVAPTVGDTTTTPTCLPFSCTNVPISSVKVVVELKNGGKKMRFMYDNVEYPRNPSGKWENASGGDRLPTLTIPTNGEEFCTVMSKLKKAYFFSKDGDDWRPEGVSFTFTIPSSAVERWYVPPLRFGDKGLHWNDRVSGTNGSIGQPNITVYVGWHDFVRVYPEDHDDDEWDYDLSDYTPVFSVGSDMKKPHGRYYLLGALPADEVNGTIFDKIFPRTGRCPFTLPDDTISVETVIRKSGIVSPDYEFSSDTCRGQFKDSWFDRDRKLEENTNGMDVFGDWYYNKDGKKQCLAPNSKNSTSRDVPCPGALTWRWKNAPKYGGDNQILQCHYKATREDIMKYDLEETLPTGSKNDNGSSLLVQLQQKYCERPGNSSKVITNSGNKTCSQFRNDFSLLEKDCKTGDTSQNDWENCKSVLDSDAYRSSYETHLRGYCDNNPMKSICACYNVRKDSGMFCLDKDDSQAAGCTKWNVAYANLMEADQTNGSAIDTFKSQPECFMPVCNSDGWTPSEIANRSCPPIQICQNNIEATDIDASAVDFSQECNMDQTVTTNTDIDNITEITPGGGSASGGGSGGDGDDADDDADDDDDDDDDVEKTEKDEGLSDETKILLFLAFMVFIGVVFWPRKPPPPRYA